MTTKPGSGETRAKHTLIEVLYRKGLLNRTLLVRAGHIEFAWEFQNRVRGREELEAKYSALLDFAEFIFTKKTYTRVFEPIIRDLQDEHIEALAADRFAKARYVQLRGYASFFVAAGAQWSSSMVATFLKSIGRG